MMYGKCKILTIYFLLSTEKIQKSLESTQFPDRIFFSIFAQGNFLYRAATFLKKEGH